MPLIQVFTINKMALLKIKHYISISSPSKTLIVWSIKVIFFFNFLLIFYCIMLISKEWLKAQLIQRTTLSAMFLEGTSFFYDIMQKGHISTK